MYTCLRLSLHKKAHLTSKSIKLRSSSAATDTRILTTVRKGVMAKSSSHLSPHPRPLAINLRRIYQCSSDELFIRTRLTLTFFPLPWEPGLLSPPPPGFFYVRCHVMDLFLGSTPEIARSAIQTHWRRIRSESEHSTVSGAEHRNDRAPVEWPGVDCRDNR